MAAIMTRSDATTRSGLRGRPDGYDHLHLPEIGLLQELEGIEVVALDGEILGGREIDRLLLAWPQGLGDGCVGEGEGFPLAWPIEPLVFLRPLDEILRKLLAEQIEIDLQG